MKVFIKILAAMLVLALSVAAPVCSADEVAVADAEWAAPEGARAPAAELPAEDQGAENVDAPVDELPEFELAPTIEAGDIPSDGDEILIIEDEAEIPEEAFEGDPDGDAEEECISEAFFVEAGDDLDDGIDGGALYDAYIDSILGVNGASDAALAQKVNGGKLTGLSKHFYDRLRGFVLQVASGSRSSTKFTVSLSGASFSFTPAQLGVSAALSGGAPNAAAQSAFADRLGAEVEKAVFALCTDYPYQLYWFNRYRVTDGGYSYSYRYRYTRKGSAWTRIQLTDSVTFSFRVSAQYASGAYSVNGSGVRAAQTAANNAAAIVARYASGTDYEKLLGYKDEICDLVRYDYDAYRGSMDGAYTYTDPWQLIWVFDGDPDTNVVCEGYAKAFQYLCDLTNFSGNICCYCVTGAIGGGRHMWNIVSMDNRKKYLVDVTNSDSGMSGQDGRLFMAGGSGSVTVGYVVGGTRYVYDSDALRTYSDSELALSDRGYLSDSQTPKTILANAALVVGVGEKVTLATNEGGVRFSTSNKKIASVSASGVVKGVKTGSVTITATATDYVSETCRVTVKKAPKKVKLSASKVSLGMGQTRKLTAKLSPAGCRPGVTWHTSNASVAVVDQSGVVTPVRPGKATITARTYNGKKKSCKVTVLPLPNRVSVGAARTKLGVGEAIKLSAALPKGSASAIRWSVTGNAVTVDASGNLRAIRVGSATVTAEALNGVSGTRTITVADAPDSIELSAYSLTIKKGRSTTLRALLPEGSAGGCTFKSSRTKVAAVSAAGKITAKKRGTAIITVTTYNGLVRTCTVTVR